MNIPLFLAALSVGGLVPLLIEVLIVAAVCWLLWWLVNYLAPPQPFLKILQCIIAVVAVLYLINLLLGLSGNAFITR